MGWLVLQQLLQEQIWTQIPDGYALSTGHVEITSLTKHKSEGNRNFPKHMQSMKNAAAVFQSSSLSSNKNKAWSAKQIQINIFSINTP
jgi:hypothetical protein